MVEMPMTEHTVTKYVIIVPRGDRYKYVGRGYNPKNDNGYTIKLNGAMMFDTMENAIKTMDWFGIEGSIGEVKRHTELVQVLRGTAQELAGGNIEISDEQMQRMVAMYRHDEDSNVAINDTLESVVCRVLGRN